SHSVGQILTITRPEGSSTQFYSKGPKAPRVTGVTTVDSATLTEWQVADRAAYERKAQAEALKRASKVPDHVGTHVAALVFAARNMSFADKRAFAQYVSSQINR